MAGLISKDKPKPSSAKRVGLDLGSQSVKLMEASHGEAVKAVISAIGYSDSPDRSGGDPVSSLKKLIEDTGLSSKEVAVSVSGPNVIERFVTMPKMKDDELESAVRFESERFVPFNIDECVIDYHLMSQDEKDGRLGLMVAIAKKSLVTEHIKIAEEAGLTVKAVDVDCFAVSNIFTVKPDAADTDKTSSIVNIGYMHTNLSIVRKGVLYFARDINLGVAHIIRTASEKTGVELRTLEEIPKLQEENRSRGVDGVRQALVDITEEMKLSFGYYENQVGRSVDEIFMTGGGSYIEKLPEVFHDTFGQDPLFLNPLENFDFKSHDDERRYAPAARVFAVCAGLALR